MKNNINVSQSNSFEVKTASICVSNSGGEWGGSPPGPPGLPWAFPMVFVVVVVVIVVVVVVVVVVKCETWSGPVDGFGCTRRTSEVQLCCFCVYFNSSGNIV